MSAQLTVVAPTLNERDNIEPLVAALTNALAGRSWELIIVDDDSPDGTARFAKALAQRSSNLRCIRRIGRRGLASAAIEGFLASSAPFVALIDADLQHDEGLLPRMLDVLERGDTDVVIGSRFVGGGSAEGLEGAGRRRLSLAGSALARRVLGVTVADPMSGFFAMRRDLFEDIAPNLSGQGFKILADILASAEPPLRTVELPYVFRSRRHGVSKIDTGVKLDYVLLLLDKTIGRFLPLRFVMFSVVGAFGVLVHLAALALYHFGFDLPFWSAQGLAALTAMTSNFLINNAVTYRDLSLKGVRLILGLLSFYAVCSVGLLANVGVANVIFTRGETWWAAGILGALVGAVWNYAASSALTWRAARG